MSDTRKPPRQKIRTFAQDLEFVRTTREQVDATPATENEVAMPRVTPKETKPTKEEVIEPKVSIPEPEKEPLPMITEIPPIVQPTPEPEPEPVKEESRPIPAFHELQKRVDSIQHASEKKTVKEDIKASVKLKRPKQVKQVARPNIGYDATVIRDTKSGRFKLFPSIAKSIKEWFAGLQKSMKTTEAPKYAVPETHRRKGVIQKATSKTGALFAADNEQIREQIRRRKELADVKQEEPLHEPETSWSPYTDTGYNLLEGPDERSDVTKNVTIEFKRPIIVEPEPEPAIEMVPPPPAPPIPPPPAETEPEEEAVTEEVPATVEDTNETIGIDLDEQRWAAGRNTEADVEETSGVAVSDTFIAPPVETTIAVTASEEEEVPNDVPVKTPTQEPDGRLIDQFDTNTLTIVLLLGIIGILFAVFVTRVILINSDREQAVEAPTVQIVEKEAIIDGASIAAVTLTSDTLDELPRLITETAANAPVGMVELAVVSPLGDEVSPSYVFELMRFRTIPNLRQSVTTMRFAVVNRSTPSVLMQVVDQDTVRGGLLSWEANMTNDMRVLYDIPTEFEERFVDETVEGRDVRVLRIDGKATLVYGFLGTNTVLIAGSTADFAQIADLGFGR